MRQNRGRVVSVITGVVEFAAVAVMMLMMFHVVANALTRTYWNHPLPHTLEWVQYWYVPAVALLGFVAAQARGEHISSDMLLKYIPTKLRPWFVASGWLLAAISAAAFAWFGYGEAMERYEVKATAGVSTLVAWPVYFLVPAAFAALTLQFAVAAVRSLREEVVLEDAHAASLEEDEERAMDRSFE
jgi:TRAP-type C4-dicarboxylate transport system permease small subunit